MPKRCSFAFMVSLAVGATSACAPTVTITPLGAERTYPAAPDTATLPLYSVAKPECPYDEIALITAEGQKSADDILAALRAKARAVGGQAIIGYAESTRAAAGVSWSVRTGTAIHFRSTDCTK
jgi:hypothetical protein